MVELLTALALAVTHRPVVVECTTALPVAVVDGQHALGNGTAEWSDGLPHIWMLPRVCRSALRAEHFGLAVFAHECLHVRPNRSEEWTQRWDDWYAENVVRWKWRRLTGGLTPLAGRGR